MEQFTRVLSVLRKEETLLERQLNRIRRAIEALGSEGGRAVKRGRKRVARKKGKMTAAQRKAVSKRMKAYWAKRRKKRGRTA